MKRRIWMAGLGMALICAMTGCAANAVQEADSTPAVTAGVPDSSGNEDVDGSGNHEIVMTWWGNQTRNERTQQAIDLYMEQNVGIDIEGQFAEWDGYWDKLATMASGGALPDVFQQHSDYLVQYNDADLMLDLTPYVEQGILDVSSIPQNVLDLGMVDGKQVALCNGLNAWGLVYDAALLEANGIEIKDNMTVEEFMNVARSVYEKTGYKTCLSATNSDAAAIMSHILRGEGVEIWQDGGLGAESYDQLKAYFDIMETGVKEGWLIDPGVLVERNGNEQQPIVYGESPAERSWCIPAASNVYLSYVNVASEGQELKLTTIPSNNSKASNQVMASQFFSISSQSEDPDTAVSFLNWLINSEEANAILLGERGVPVNPDIVGAITGLIDEPTKNSMSYVNDVIMPNSSAGSPATGAEMAEVKDVFAQLYEQVCYGEMTSEDAAKTLFEEGNAILK